MVGWVGSPCVVRYRAPYGVNNDADDDDDYLLALNFQIGRIDHPTLIGKVGSSQSEGSAEN